MSVLKILLSRCGNYLFVLSSSHRLCCVFVFVIQYEFVFGIVMCANIGSSERGDEKLHALENGAINASRGDAIGATRREAADVSGPSHRRSLSKIRRECRCMLDVGRFRAMVVDGNSLVIYELNNY